MPIKFRCQFCQQFLGISRSKAGEVTDCPTCGRSIRVPHLDGHVEDLPSPQLDLKDSQLREALGELATLGSNDLKYPADEVEEQDFRDDSPTGRPTEQPAVRSIEPIEVVPVVDPPQLVVDGSPESEQHSELPFAIIDENAHFGEGHSQSSIHESPRRRQRSGFQFGPVVLLIVSLLTFGCGWLIGNSRKGTAFPAKEIADQQSNAALSDGDSELGQKKVQELVHVQGIIRFEESTGTLLPDRGAHVLILPLMRTGKTLLSPLGMRVGTDEVDERILRASVKELGGEMVRADDQGKFTATVPAGTNYGILVTSRYQAREGEPVLSEKAREFLGNYFERPTDLLGRVQFEYREVDAQLIENGELTFTFAIE